MELVLPNGSFLFRSHLVTEQTWTLPIHGYCVEWWKERPASAIDSLPTKSSPLPPELELRNRTEETAKLERCRATADSVGGNGGGWARGCIRKRRKREVQLDWETARPEGRMANNDSADIGR
ncbi:uncharacterized protein LOC120294743 [Eucalyptus grandis]|uniref:uncharacterized protein LOC120294743 n=1 Tax=Eucalyptus grandis TaxID=71139 RepID=UPI00192E7B8C|nr:uncharacterized protein LOC120294743 [Eucalyptus grandis]